MNNKSKFKIGDFVKPTKWADETPNVYGIIIRKEPTWNGIRFTVHWAGYGPGWSIERGLELVAKA